MIGHPSLRHVVPQTWAFVCDCVCVKQCPTNHWLSGSFLYDELMQQNPGFDFNRIRRSRSDRFIGGVCSGLAKETNLPSWLWRVIFVITLGCGSGLAYLVMWYFVPDDSNTSM
jgi:phage shock protein PspC (stress-responsive transcriptional regulator)